MNPVFLFHIWSHNSMWTNSKWLAFFQRWPCAMTGLMTQSHTPVHPGPRTAHGEGSRNIFAMSELSITNMCWTCHFEPWSNAVKMYWQRGKRIRVQTTWSSNSHPKSYSRSQEGETILIENIHDSVAKIPKSGHTYDPIELLFICFSMNQSMTFLVG